MKYENLPDYRNFVPLLLNVILKNLLDCKCGQLRILVWKILILTEATTLRS